MWTSIYKLQANSEKIIIQGLLTRQQLINQKWLSNEQMEF